MPWLKHHWFLVALTLVFAVGFVASEPLGWFHQQGGLRRGIVFVVMLLTGLVFNPGTLGAHLRRPVAALLAIGLNLFAVPLACWGWIFVLPDHLFGGLFVASLVPCTLASAAVWTRKAGGDDSVALLTTVVTNLACVVVVPLGISIGIGHRVSIAADQQFTTLAILVVLPLVLAQGLRRAGLGLWADRHKPAIAVASQIGILAMIFFGAIASGQVADASPSGSGFYWGAILLLAVTCVHAGCLGLGILTARRAGFPRQQQIAVGFSGSQKTMMVGLQIALDCGVSVVPMIAYHVTQLVMDTVIARYWRSGAWSAAAAVAPEGSSRVD